MKLLFLMLRVYWRNRRQPPVSELSGRTEETFRVSLGDLDSNWHMNNARYLNYLEAGRFSLQCRTGFLALARKRRWFSPVVQLRIAYYRPLKLFQKFSVSTQIIKVEERWLYLLHEIFSSEKLICRALVRSTIRSGRDNVPPQVYATAAGYEVKDISVPNEVQDWLNEMAKDLPR